MDIPSATYRIQFHKDFTLAHLARIANYLHELGISTIYASPITQATPGSLHGYDVVNPDIVNPEIGTAATWKKLTASLRKKNMWWLQDIVPNHMAFATQNTRLMDVLERGSYSPYHQYFDIRWKHHAPDLHGKVMAPFLGDDLVPSVEKGDIRLAWSDSGLNVQVYDNPYPLSAPAYHLIAAQLPPAEHTDALRDALNQMPAAAATGSSLEEWFQFKHEWTARLQQHEGMLPLLLGTVDTINADHNRLLELLGTQYYTLTNWRRASYEINYRRFFTVNSLICLQMEEDTVFDDYHRFLHSAYQEGIIRGLRIDHIDGLYDPTEYIGRLRKLFGTDCYIIAEKILETEENLPASWKLQGTSGYEFLSYLNQLLTSIKGAAHLLQFYRQLFPEMPAYDELVLQNKLMILEKYMGGEWENLMQQFMQLNLHHNYDREKIKKAFGAVMVALPVYRIYPDHFPLAGESLALMKQAFETARHLRPELVPELFYLESLLLNPGMDGDLNNRALLFLKRMMQFTGPLMAKGVEDTTFYVYNAHIVHNEVGDDPSVIGISIEAFHNTMTQRYHNTPLSLNATATHDTKRGEDARMRINVLSEVFDEWQEKVKQWLDINQSLRTMVRDKTAPSLNDEYFLYQSIVGGFPPDFKITAEWIQRLQAYMVKALREAKVNSNWDDPYMEYEQACKQFIHNLFQPRHAFLASFKPFVEKISTYAGIYSLAQVLIKFTAPGIPDIYQGCELWDFSYVDPDNRRPVNFARRKKMLKALQEKEQEGADTQIAFAKAHWREGYEKLLTTWKILQFRRQHNELFAEGEYLPLEVTGPSTEAIAFARRFNGQYIIAVAPLNVASKYTDRGSVQEYHNEIQLPDGAPTRWQHVITGEVFEVAHRLSLQQLFASFPIALLTAAP
jgi:(1->4)-alpha-D-glucan 1-alpha-D-glucosylmutase